MSRALCNRQGRMEDVRALSGPNTGPRGNAPRERDHGGRDHPVPFRTRQLSLPSPKVLRGQPVGGQDVALAQGVSVSAERPEGPPILARIGGPFPLRRGPQRARRARRARAETDRCGSTFGTILA